MKVIGFTKKFYTLWEVETSIVEDEYGKYQITHYQFCKNVSFDFDKAKAAYPDADINLDLCAHHSWSTTKCIEHYKTDEFRWGKYKGYKLTECTDYDYLAWAFDKAVVPEESRNIVVSMLEEQGYKQINDAKIVNPATAAIIEQSYIDCENNVVAMEENGYIIVNFKSGTDENGFAWDSNRNIHFKFNNLKNLYYAGHWYTIPQDMNGKGKKIKNQTVKIIPEHYDIEVSEYGWGANLEVTVKDFEIIKNK